MSRCEAERIASVNALNQFQAAQAVWQQAVNNGEPQHVIDQLHAVMQTYEAQSQAAYTAYIDCLAGNRP